MAEVQVPSQATYWVIPGHVLFLVLPLLGLAWFSYMMARRMTPLLRGAPDPRFNHLPLRFVRILKFWLGQWKQPRYLAAGVLHIVIFAGFLVLSIRSVSLVLLGMSQHFEGLTGALGHFYNLTKDDAATFVLLAVVIAAIRRAVLKPSRYAVPARYGKDHTAEALLILGLIGTLMVSESLCEASSAAFGAAAGQMAEAPAPLSLAWMMKSALLSSSPAALTTVHLGAYLIHELTFFTFLCVLPVGKHFHVVTSFFNVYFSKLDRRGTVKPVRWGVADEQLNQVKSFGVKQFEEFTWKQMLDF